MLKNLEPLVEALSKDILKDAAMNTADNVDYSCDSCACVCDGCDGTCDGGYFPQASSEHGLSINYKR